MLRCSRWPDRESRNFVLRLRQRLRLRLRLRLRQRQRLRLRLRLRSYEVLLARDDRVEASMGSERKALLHFFDLLG